MKKTIAIQNYAAPRLFEKGTSSIWTDPYISRQLLAAHLDPQFEGASRREAFIDQSVEWITRRFPTTRFSKVIDFGCGPGLHAQEAARKQELAITYHQADYLNWQPIQQYDLGLLIYCDYGALDKAAREKILAMIHASLRPGGCLVMDNFTTNDLHDFSPRKTWEHISGSDFWAQGEHLLLMRSEQYEPTVVLDQTIVVTDAGEQIFNLWKYYSDKESLIKEVEAAGFVSKGLYLDVAGAPFREEGHTIAIVAEKV